MRLSSALFAALIALSSAACGDSDTGGAGAAGGSTSEGVGGQGGQAASTTSSAGSGGDPGFDVAGAVAFVVVGDRAAPGAGVQNGVLFTVDAQDQARHAWAGRPSGILSVDGGLVVSSEEGVYFVLPDGSYDKYPYGVVRGALSTGEVVLEDGTALSATGTRKIAGTDANTRIAYVSGDLGLNYAPDGSTLPSVIALVGGAKSVDVASCNGPRFVALGRDGLALVDDCDADPLLDVATGAREAADLSDLDEAVVVDDGAVVLSQECAAAGSGRGLCHVDLTGQATPLADQAFDVEGACDNCGGLNYQLFTDGAYAVVLEKAKVSGVDFAGHAQVDLWPGRVASWADIGPDHVAWLVSNTGPGGFAHVDLTTNTRVDLQVPGPLQLVQVARGFAPSP